MTCNLRRGLVMAFGLTLSACGELLPNEGCGLVLEGVRFERPSTETNIPLAVGETRSYAAIVGPLSFQAAGCPAPLPTVASIQWHASGITRSGEIRARLVSCKACTVLYDDRRTPANGNTGVAGAATVSAASQAVIFEVTGVSPGLEQLDLFACADNDKDCMNPASDSLSFRVSAP